MAGKESFIYRATEVSKKLDVLTLGLGIIAASAPVVFFGMLSYIAGDAFQSRLKKS